MKTFDRVVFSVIGIALSVIAVRPFVAPTSSAAAPPREYRFVMLPGADQGHFNPQAVQAMLNKVISEGWEIQQVIEPRLLLRR